MKPIYIILFSLVLIACGKSEKTVETQIISNEITVTASQFKGEKMQLSKVTEQVFNQTIKTSGMIDVPPENKANVSALMGGYITKTPLLIGDRVSKGQLLVTLENTEFVEIQQHYLEIAAKIDYLKSEFERQQTLFNENITSQKNFLKAKSNYKSSLAQYNGLRKKLKMMYINPQAVERGEITSKINVYAPIEGFITKINVSNGAYISPMDVILEIVNTAHIHLELSVFEKDILSVKKHQKILFEIPEASNKLFEAEVHLVGTTIDENNRTVKVHAHIDNEKQADFIVGMFVEAEIIKDTKTSWALPKDAVIKIENNYFVLILTKKSEDFTFEKVKLEIGQETKRFIEIVNVSEIIEKEILIKGAFMLLAE